ncbi:MAG: DUF1192 family protein [Phenylobacterium sp.]
MTRGVMMEEAEEARRGRGAVLDLALREDLDLFSLDDLADRIGFLEAEITRCRAQIARKAAGREAADALFRKPED